MKTNKKEFHPTTEMLQTAQEYLQAEAYYITIEPIIKGIQQALLTESQYRHRETNKVITNPKDTWLMGDIDFTQYSNLLHHRYLENGFQPKYGYCPLLVAEDELRKAGKKLINSLHSITGLSAMDVINAKDGKGLAHFKDFIEVSLRLLVPYLECEK
ncbi:hypothetical protein [Fluoribacter dumoffii]|uniref:Uncharacterized protein n=1 Tax=Fluoribacter dumoffii TaxID=463 RepID=A0A377IVU6_9GAMM|nr:hypothetical protein [Fluoribacter dumoffii]STO91552.1 Uncharacterised protein [Fluoribacter dumoffii]